MGRSLQALGRMFDVLLDISRLDAGAMPVAAQPMPLRPLLQRLHDELAGVAAARGLMLRLWLPAHGRDRCTTCTDPVPLERCLRNLLDNAIKYTRRGGVLLALRPRRAGGAPSVQYGRGVHWQVQVLDTGIGMTPEVLARAFDEFYQADNPERDRARGLGLGLPIVQRLVRLMGHELAWHSEAGRGTRAVLTLPALEATDAAAPPLPAPPPAAAGSCVAVLDDDAEVREGLQAVLERWGHTVLAAADDEALVRSWRACGSPRMHAIVTDLRLRGTLTGVAAVAALRRAWAADVPALVITGDVAADRLQLLRASGLPWLPKPVMPMRLRTWLTQVGAPASP